jgi:hypothetical protein
LEADKWQGPRVTETWTGGFLWVTSYYVAVKVNGHTLLVKTDSTEPRTRVVGWVVAKPPDDKFFRASDLPIIVEEKSTAFQWIHWLGLPLLLFCNLFVFFIGVKLWRKCRAPGDVNATDRRSRESN